MAANTKVRKEKVVSMAGGCQEGRKEYKEARLKLVIRYLKNKHRVKKIGNV